MVGGVVWITSAAAAADHRRWLVAADAAAEHDGAVAAGGTDEGDRDDW